MAGEFGRFIDEKRRGRGPGGTDILLKDIAEAMGKTATYLSDITYVRAALRRAIDKRLGNDFWKKVYETISNEES